jgi:hypothetical protein
MVLFLGLSFLIDFSIGSLSFFTEELARLWDEGRAEFGRMLDRFPCSSNFTFDLNWLGVKGISFGASFLIAV